jgi:hypothetical protein
LDSVVADSSGVFVIATRHYDQLRLSAAAGGYVEVVTPAFRLTPDELLTVEVVLSTRHQPLASLFLIAREFARMYSTTDIRGFDFRRRSRLGGIFLDSAAIGKAAQSSLKSLLLSIPGVNDSGDTLGGLSALTLGAVGIPRLQPARQGTSSGPAICRPRWFVNGELRRGVDGVPDDTRAIRGVELYLVRDDVPAPFNIGRTECGAIIVWTKG